MKLIYFLLSIIALFYFISIPIFFYEGKISASELISLLGIIPLSVIALFQEHFKRWFFSPKLKIEFKLDAPYCSKTPFYIGWGDPKGNPINITTEAYGFRFGVINEGKSQAKQCEAFISDLKEYTNESWKDVDFFQQVNLKWDTGKSKDAYLCINPSHIKIMCDIGHIVKPTTGLREDFTKKFYLAQHHIIGGYQPQDLAINKKYRFEVTIASENAKPVSRSFELLWTGVWKDNPEEMFKEVQLKCIK